MVLSTSRPVNTKMLRRWHQCGRAIQVLRCAVVGLSLPLAKVAVSRTGSGQRPLQIPPRASLSDTILKRQLILHSVSTNYASMAAYI